MPGMNTASFERQVKALQAGLDQFKESVQRKIARAALKQGMTVVNKAVKRGIPARWKDIKKLIGQRLLKRAAGEEIAGKVGVAVGGAGRAGSGKGDKFKAKKKKDRTGHAGVGVAAQNVHWFILGTAARMTKRSTMRHPQDGQYLRGKGTEGGHSTGTMPPQVPDIVRLGFERSYSAALAKIIEATRAGIVREAAKIAAAVKAAM